jgi:hypothetical protein
MEQFQNIKRLSLAPVIIFSLYSITGCGETTDDQHSSLNEGVLPSAQTSSPSSTSSPGLNGIQKPGLNSSAVVKDGAKGCDVTKITNDIGAKDQQGDLYPDDSFVGVYHCAPPALNPDNLEGPYIINPNKLTIEPIKLVCPKVGDVVFQPSKNNQQDTVVYVDPRGLVFDISSANSQPGDSGGPITNVQIPHGQQTIRLSNLRGVLTGKKTNSPESPTRSSCTPFRDQGVYKE